jgi:hypothetical protein
MPTHQQNPPAELCASCFGLLIGAKRSELRRMCFGCFDTGASAKQPLNSRVSGDVSLHPDQHKSTIPTIVNSPIPYEPPSPTSQQVNRQQPSQPPPPSPSAATISSLEKTSHQDFSSMPVPEKGAETSLTGWLFYRTGTVITTYEKAFFVLEEGFLYLYNQPKRSAASDKGTYPSTPPLPLPALSSP